MNKGLRKKFLIPFVLLLLFFVIFNQSSSSVNTDQDELPSAVLGTAPAPRGEAVNYFSEDAKTEGYFVTPDTKGKKPGLLIVHEWNGLSDRIRQMADNLADEGYVVLAADMYSGREGHTRDENISLMTESRANPELMVRNLDAAAKFLRSQSDVKADKIGTMGWCYGGGVVLTYAIGGENHQATAMFYGSLVQDPEELMHIGHDVLGLFAKYDGGIPPEDVRKFEASLNKVGVPNEIHIYDDVGHGFFLWVDKEPRRKKSATDAWNKLKSFLSRTLS